MVTKKPWLKLIFLTIKTLNVNDAYSNFNQKLMEVIDKVAPVKRNSRQWFDIEISEKLIIPDKLLKK